MHRSLHLWPRYLSTSLKRKMSKPKSAAANRRYFGSEISISYRYRIDIGKEDIDPPLIHAALPPTARVTSLMTIRRDWLHYFSTWIFCRRRMHRNNYANEAKTVAASIYCRIYCSCGDHLNDNLAFWRSIQVFFYYTADKRHRQEIATKIWHVRHEYEHAVRRGIKHTSYYNETDTSSYSSSE